MEKISGALPHFSRSHTGVATAQAATGSATTDKSAGFANYCLLPYADSRNMHYFELEQTIARYTDLYSSAPVACFSLDAEGVILDANLMAAGMLGATRSSLRGRRLEGFIADGARLSYTIFLEQVFLRDSKETCELTFVDSDGQRFFAHVEASADVAGETCRIVLCDISERKQAEVGLIESEERFRLMADSAPVLIWITGPNQNYLWFNKMWLDFSGRRLDEELGSGWLDGVHEDDRDACVAIQTAAFRTREPFSMEYRLMGQDGQFHYMLARGVPRSSPTRRFLGYIGSTIDITERKKVEEALRHSRQLLRHLVSYQEKVREDERKRIAREIHDDLGQNLLALRIDVSMLHTRTLQSHPKLNARVQVALDHIDATIKAVRAAINNLRPAVLDLGLGAAIEWQVQDFKRRSGIACELQMDDDFSLDDNRATALFRILQESLNNVLRHARASQVRISLHREGAQLFMQICDNGVGIYPACRRKANSFGLVGIEERISALGGGLSIDGDKVKGTTLTVSMPLLST
ncbi:MAG TPA: PAS domain S-box protein [Noviherbaspirillum sp.]|jgi:PAS domain S-box-containing protein|uniref:PAS domain-containing sensor histidine kinase n=1 Tax=Noviherbaspirillum sp. TaxID=1926288 RepID=UPI002F94A46C